MASYTQVFQNDMFTLEEAESHDARKCYRSKDNDEMVECPSCDSYKLLISMCALERREDEFGDPFKTLLAQISVDRYAFADGSTKTEIASAPQGFLDAMMEASEAISEWVRLRVATVNNCNIDMGASAPVDAEDDEVACAAEALEYMPDGDAPQYAGIAG